MISSDHKVIFPHIPGTAGSSIEQCFVGNWNHVDPHTKHAPADYYKNMHRAEWDQYFRFSIVRNPWDRVKSLARFQRKAGCLHHIHPSIEENGMVSFVKSTLRELTIYDYFVGREMHAVFKFEELDDAWEQIRKVVSVFAPGSPDLPQKLHHVSIGGDCCPERKLSRKDFFEGEQEAIDLIGQHHAVDIQRWGYNF